MSKYITIPVTGKLYWVELWFRDNSTNPKGTQVVDTEMKVVRTVSISRFNESIKNTVETTKNSFSVGAEVGASYGPVSATVKSEFLASKEIQDTYGYTVREQQDMSVQTTIKDSRGYNVEGHGKLGLYQAFFSAPGVVVSLTQTRTGGETPAAQDVTFDLKLQELQFIKEIQAVYTDNPNDRPFDCLHEITGQNEDINSGFGGKYCYLKPIFTNQVNQAMTQCRVRVDKSAVRGPNITDDLAKGAGGKFRYLQFNQDSNTHSKFTAAALLRRAGNAPTLKDAPGYAVMTTDINEGRKGDWLYVVFQTKEVFGIEKVPS
ncbi:MAG: hypothetical protein Q9224_005920 [Gallowayella concinna]